MQVQRVNSNQPNFQALKMTNVTKKVRNDIRNINIYSLDCRDREFVDRMYNVAKSQAFPEDSRLLGGNTVREVFDSALKKARSLSQWAYDRVFLAVEDGNKITGIMEILGKGDQRVKGLAVWNNDHLTRKSLVLTAMKDTERLSDFALMLPSEKSAESVKDYYRKMKFYTPKDDKQLMIECGKLKSAVQTNEKLMDAKITHHRSTKSVDLAKILKLDE
ncbi:TPA: hypothetical protein IAC10_09130 [Candidatus Scatousia excrementigallinarum]|uniref:Uncharacterized protein n=1 Tax=Candidatus Scatousia excrementigallinarum TaxID=2840935 RepID=A0A9D1EZM8_9BACT|nr:hypothetical protein [Candidatus Scatousia excrementigallinarum]